MNIFAGSVPPPGSEHAETLAEGSGVTVRRITSLDHATPSGQWYEQAEREWVALLSGSAVVEFADGERAALWPGEWLDIPPGRRHRIARTSADQPTVWLAVHFPADRSSARG
ncbi:MAG: cupin domain-containing protein [Gammaproteobacteria bacterium]